MLIPQRKELFQGLRKWREDNKDTEKDVAKRSKELLAEGKINVSFTERNVKRWESLEQAPSYDRLVQDILPSYGVNNSLIFLVDYLASESITLSDITPFYDKEGQMHEFDLQGKGRGKTKHPLSFSLKNHFACLEICTLSEGYVSVWDEHPGWEYIHVLKGYIECSFSEDANSENPQKIIKLNQGDAISFPSKLFHSIKSPKKKSTIAVSRPYWFSNGERTIIEERYKI